MANFAVAASALGLAENVLAGGNYFGLWTSSVSHNGLLALLPLALNAA